MRSVFVQPAFVQLFSSNPFRSIRLGYVLVRLGLDEMDWTKTGWTKNGSTLSLHATHILRIYQIHYHTSIGPKLHLFILNYLSDIERYPNVPLLETGNRYCEGFGSFFIHKCSFIVVVRWGSLTSPQVRLEMRRDFNK